MFFEIEGHTFRIKFYREGNTTIAELFEVLKDAVEGSDPMVSLGAYGVALLHHSDRFEKKIGRKVALSHLLEGLSEPENSSPLLLDKGDREMIWKKYFETHKK